MAFIQRLSQSVKHLNENLLVSTRSKYLFTLDVLAIDIGVASKKIISYTKEYSPTNQ